MLKPLLIRLTWALAVFGPDFVPGAGLQDRGGDGGRPVTAALALYAVFRLRL